MFCPLCGTVLYLAEDGIWFVGIECDYNEEVMAIEELQVP